MNIAKRLRNLILILGFIISIWGVNPMVNLHAQPPPTIAEPKTPKSLINQLLAVDNNRGRRRFPRAELGRTIAQDEGISPKNRVAVLIAILRHELENPCSLTHFIHGGYIAPTGYIQRQYVFGLEDIGSRAIPHLRKHLVQLKLSIQNLSPSLGNTESVDMVEMQHILCALGLLADKDVLKDLLKILEDEDGDGYIRQMAARALGNIGDKSAIPALTRALKDDFHVNYTNLMQPSTIYPVREAACHSLDALGVKIELVSDDTFRVVR